MFFILSCSFKVFSKKVKKGGVGVSASCRTTPILWDIGISNSPKAIDLEMCGASKGFS
jgi:hypothetical protein